MNDQILKCIDLMRKFCWAKAFELKESDILRELDAVLATMPGLSAPKIPDHIADAGKMVGEDEAVAAIQSRHGLHDEATVEIALREAYWAGQADPRKPSPPAPMTEAKHFPIPLEEAKRRNVCRLCGLWADDPEKLPLILNYGHEFAHEACLSPFGDKHFCQRYQKNKDARGVSVCGDCWMEAVRKQPTPDSPPAPMTEAEYRAERERLIEECKQNTDCQIASAVWDDPGWAKAPDFKPERSKCTPFHQAIAALDARWQAQQAEEELNEPTELELQQLRQSSIGYGSPCSCDADGPDPTCRSPHHREGARIILRATKEIIHSCCGDANEQSTAKLVQKIIDEVYREGVMYSRAAER